MSRYSGSDWIERQLERKGEKLSDLGRDVADLLGYLYQGIYHINRIAYIVDWQNPSHIALHVGDDYSTFDFNNLTTLVFLAHRMAIRVEIQPCNFHYIRLLFHRRQREGDLYYCHPTIRQALETFEADCYLPELTPTPVQEDR